MDPIYVTGHRNPDTDSIVSAIAYAALRNSVGDREFVPARLGHISDETQRILDRFEIQPPERISTMRTQVKDLEFDVPPALNAGVTISRAWEALQSNRSIPAIPVTDEEGHLFAMISPADIANFDMEVTAGAEASNIPVFNLLSVLEGQILNETGNLVDSVSGEVVIALPQQQESLIFRDRDAIIICGDQPDMARRALERNVSCLIVCQAELPEELRQLPTKTCIISTPFDAVRTARLIYYATPVDRICRKSDFECFHLNDFLDDVQEVVSKSRHRNYPILDEQDKVVGTLSRFHLLRPKRKKVVLVDHNEIAQSVPGLEEADIVEIIDHHRLADIQTLKSDVSELQVVADELKIDVTALQNAIEAIQKGFDYKGSVASQSALPSNPEVGDCYTVTNEDNAEYLWDGSNWIDIGSSITPITKAQINALFT